MRAADAYLCIACDVLFELPAVDDQPATERPRGGNAPPCPECGEGKTRPLRRALLEGRKLDELPDLLTEDELSAWLGIARKTLRQWRNDGLMPEFIRVGRITGGPVRYDRRAVNAFLDARRERRVWR